MKERLPHLALGVAMVAISLSAIFIRWSDSSPLVAAAHRQAFATLLFLPPLLWNRAAGLRRLTRRELTSMAVIGLLLGAHFGFFFAAVKATSVATAVLLATCHPVFVAAVGAVVLGETLSRQAQRGMALALAGMLLLLGGDLLQDPGTLHGNGLALVSGLLAGAYYLGGRSLRQTVALADYALVVYAFSALALWSAVFAAGDAWQSLSQREYLLFGLMALVPTLLGHTLQNWALGYLPAFVVTVTLLAEPVGAGLLALAIFGEQPGWPELLGGAAVLAGIWAVAIPRKLSAA